MAESAEPNAPHWNTSLTPGAPTPSTAAAAPVPRNRVIRAVRNVVSTNSVRRPDAASEARKGKAATPAAWATIPTGTMFNTRAKEIAEIPPSGVNCPKNLTNCSSRTATDWPTIRGRASAR